MASIARKPTIASDRREVRLVDERMRVLADIAAAVASRADAPRFIELRTSIEASTVSPEDVFGAYLAVGPTVGAARLIAAAPFIADLLGYDLDADLEQPA